MRLLIALAAALMTAMPTAATASQEPISSEYVAAMETFMSVEQVQRDVGLAESAYSRIHPGYTRYTDAAELRAAWESIITQAKEQGGMTLPQFYLATELVLTRIRCDHTKAELPKLLKEARAGQPLYLPFRWALVEGRGMIEQAGEETGLSRGDEVLAIDGRPLEEIVAAVAPYVPVDGYTEWARNREITQSSEFMGGAVDHFGMMLWGAEPQAWLSIRDASGEVRDVGVERVDYAQWAGIGNNPRRNFKDSVAFERIGSNAAYLRVDTFVNYRVPVPPQELYGPVFQALKDEGRDTLILDLRQNGGGSTDASQGLVANLVPNARPFMREFRVATLDHTPWNGMLNTWDARALNPDPRGFAANADGSFTLRDGILEDTALITPTDVAFDGRLIVLTSVNNSSGSTNVLAHLSSRPNTTTIGEKTGGSAEGPTAGVMFFLTLPESGVVMRIPMFRQWNNVDGFEEGLGITPDITAPLTVEDFLANRDPALERAKQIAAQPVAAVRSAVSQPMATISDFAPLVGDDWEGELEYLNYGRSDRSTIPVRMVALEPQNRKMQYGFLYPGEEEKNANDSIRVSSDGTSVNGMVITRRERGESGTLILEMEAQGRDDNRPADIRLTYSISQNRFTVRKDVRFEGGEFFNRNEYRLTR